MPLVLDKQCLQAEVIPESLHAISSDDISKSALKVLHCLNKAGFQAYLVGGSVRDIMLDRRPKDFDVATDATPEQVRKLFKNSMIIGRRFKIVHVRYGHDIIEVATLRGHHLEPENHLHAETGMILRDNVYGELEDDVVRRDYTVNALYYNIEDLSVVDYVGGVADLNSRIIRIIGEPELRYREDPVRILRAIRFAAKLNFTIDQQTSDAMISMKELLLNVASARLFDEIIKMSMCGSVSEVCELLNKYQLTALLFPAPERSVRLDETGYAQKLIQAALAETDVRIQSGKTINPAFLIAVMFWYPLQQRMTELTEEGMKLFAALAVAQSEILKNLSPIVVPRRLQVMVRDIWTLQYHLPQTRRNRIFRCLYHPRFRAAYDFMLLRMNSGEPLEKDCDFWTEFQEATQDEQQDMIREFQTSKRSNNRGKYRRREKK